MIHRIPRRAEQLEPTLVWMRSGNSRSSPQHSAPNTAARLARLFPQSHEVARTNSMEPYSNFCGTTLSMHGPSLISTITTVMARRIYRPSDGISLAEYWEDQSVKTKPFSSALTKASARCEMKRRLPSFRPSRQNKESCRVHRQRAG